MPKTKTRTRPLALQGFEGNLLFTSRQVWAWYLVAPQRWSFRSDLERINLYEGMKDRLAALAGREVHLRITSEPFPAEVWAQQLDEATPDPLDLDAWARYLLASQDRVARATTAEKRVYLGVQIGKRPRGGKPGRREAENLARQESAVAGIVAGPGLEATPASTRDLEWLLHRSIGLCLPPPPHLSAVPAQEWDSEDLHQITDDVDHEPVGPFVNTVRLTRHSQGAGVNVAVYTLGRVEDVWGVDPALPPWLTVPDAMTFPVEVSARFSVIAGEDVRGRIAHQVDGVRDQKSDYEKNGMKHPRGLDHQEEMGMEKEDETTRGLPGLATRSWGWVRFAVPGDDENQALKHAEDLATAYRARQMDLSHPRGAWAGAGQYDLVREFIPGEPLASRTHLRRMPARYVAAGTPQVSSALGDSQGPYLGYTAGATRRSVMFDPWHSTEFLGQSGAFAALGTQGSGKSFLAGSIIYPAVLGGARATVYDPSGPLAALCRMPELAPYARHRDLLRGASGSLNPYDVVTEPHRRDFMDEADPEAAWNEAKADAQRTRKLLALDILLMLLPPSMAALPRTRMLLEEVVWQTEGRPLTPLQHPVDTLHAMGRQGDDEARALAAKLYRSAEMPMARLLFPPGTQQHEPGADEDDIRLNVLTAPGLQMPPEDVPREHWGAAELLAVPVLHMAAWSTNRFIYGRPKDEPKLAIFDEGHNLADWPAGRALFRRVNRDNRKWNLAVGFFSQNPEDLDAMGVLNFISTLFAGRMQDAPTASRALRQLGLPLDSGYEQVLLSLTTRGVDKPGPREFVVRDSRGRVDRMTVDAAHVPNLAKVLDTNAKGRAAKKTEVAA